MRVRFKVGSAKWMILTTIFLLSAFVIVGNGEARIRGEMGTQSCINCHESARWRDNGAPYFDIVAGNADIDYLPLNIPSSVFGGPFYTIPGGYYSSSHYTPPFGPAGTDFVKCEGCHGGGIAHFGIGPIPKPIPTAAACGSCHKSPYFEFSEFLSTSHANRDRKPFLYFDQGGGGRRPATLLISRRPIERVSLFKANQSTPVTKNERIEECSVCHNYALQYDQFKDRIGGRGSPTPQVGCGSCHDAHIPGPNGNQLLTVNSTVQVSGVSGTTVTAVGPVDPAVNPDYPRKVSYRNLKPYKINDTGAQDFVSGLWTRGSAVSRPNITIVSGIGTPSESVPGSGNPDRLFFAAGGFSENVQPDDTVLISGQASGTANLPADALNPNAPVTVQTTLARAGFEVESVIDDNTLAIKPSVKATATVTYKKATGTGTFSVPVIFSGQVNFEVRDMRTNTETLCGSCHTQGKYKFTAFGKKKDRSFIDLSTTHNINILGQYKNSGHADKHALAFAEFSAFEYGSTHQPTYPFDMSITGSGGLNSLRNKGNTTHQLTQTPNPANAYLAVANNTTQPVLINNYTCNQCHHGLGSIDYQKDRQGTPEAQVLWGDATVTCLTCHDPHKDQNRTGKNVRIPAKLSYNSRFVDANKNPRGGINKFMDGTDLPNNLGNGVICLFCHQGRESGLTVYKAIIAARPAPADPNFPYSNPGDLISAGGVSFVNPHYLDGGAILWSRNAWEFFFNGVPQRYTTGNTLHQQTNCAGCHMGEANADNSEGGHTWKPRIETCQKCHGPITSFTSVPAPVDYDGDGQVKTVFEELGTINPDTGLFGQVKAALASEGIIYNPDSHPYFFTATGGQFRAWTSNTLTAAFNLAFSYKAGNAVYVHNARYIVQVLQDSLKALGLTPTGVRPEGNRDATDYRTIVVNR